MIKINLTPVDEIESPFWYVPDLVLAVVVALAGYFGVNYYQDGIREQIEKLTAEQQSKVDSTNRLSPDLERFKNLGAQIEEVKMKKRALDSITSSPVSKFRPLIVLEHLQNIKPDGVWLNEVKIGSKGKQIDNGAGSSNQLGGSVDENFEVKGQSFDHILTAEYITAMRSTETQDFDRADLRTQIYFRDLRLEEAQLPGQPPAGFPELGFCPDFYVTGKFSEKVAGATKMSSPGVRTQAENQTNHSQVTSAQNYFEKKNGRF